LVIQDEIAFRQERLENLAKAKAVLDARAKERYETEKAEYDAKLKEREAKAHQRHHTCPDGRCQGKPRGKEPKPPEEGPRDKDQYNSTDPDSRIMKNSTNNGYDQHYNAQVAVTQNSMFIVATSLSNHPNDKQETEPTLDAFPAELGQPEGVAMDMAISVPATSKRLKNAASNLTLQQIARRTTSVWMICLETF
jgi:hypothetical protein